MVVWEWRAFSQPVADAGQPKRLFDLTPVVWTSKESRTDTYIIATSRVGLKTRGTALKGRDVHSRRLAQVELKWAVEERTFEVGGGTSKMQCWQKTHCTYQEGHVVDIDASNEAISEMVQSVLAQQAKPCQLAQVTKFRESAEMKQCMVEQTNCVVQFLDQSGNPVGDTRSPNGQNIFNIFGCVVLVFVQVGQTHNTVTICVESKKPHKVQKLVGKLILPIQAILQTTAGNVQNSNEQKESTSRIFWDVGYPEYLCLTQPA
eukprot:c15909_g1_i3.p1 GENE.c15909_g1_i3~~c15909_g1_i3.p1  ORF type:complete len:261 (+),score=60.71 c15909_g1_i3:56-838(+)